MSAPRIGVVALSSPVGPVELELGLTRLRASGFAAVVHPNVLNRHFVNAGTDDERAQSLLDYAFDDSIDVIWCARGGYGAARVATKLAEATKTRGVPKRKRLVGYSDVTFLHEFVRQAWGWETLHAPMIAASQHGPGDTEWAAVDALVRGERPALAYETPCLRWLANRPSADITGELIGGNLSLWTSLAGTPWQPSARGRILFFEDIGEKLYRLDRYVVQLEQAGMFNGAAAVVLGDFTNCDDEAPTVLDATEDLGNIDWNRRAPMRATVSLDEGIMAIFGRVAERLGLPLATGLPVGHGPSYWPLVLGARHRVTGDGALRWSGEQWRAPQQRVSPKPEGSDSSDSLAG